MKLTVIDSHHPQTLTKRYRLTTDGLKKETVASMTRGRAEVVELPDLAAFAALLESLRHNQALCFGVPAESPVTLVTKEEYRKAGEPQGMLPRSVDAFSWPSGAGVLVLDHDAHADAGLARDELLSKLREAVPGLADAGCVWWPSSSSHIAHAETGEDLTGLRGQRVYIGVQDAADIPRAGKAIVTALWAAGLGHIEVGCAGQMLERTLIDASVWQTNRLDFAAGAQCDAPLRQERGRPVVMEGPLLDTRAAIPDPSPEQEALAAMNRKKARQDVQADADLMRDLYIDARAAEIAGDGASDEGLEQARNVVKRAVSGAVLAGDFPVTVQGADGVLAVVTVGQLLDAPAQYHGSLTLDPIEPDYEGRKVVGKLYLMGSRPTLYSFAHGGRTFKLLRQPSRVELLKGRTHDAVLQTVDLLRELPDVFDFGGQLALVNDGKVWCLDEHGLTHYLGGVFQYWRWAQTPSGGVYEVLEDPPARLVKALLSLGDARRLKRLEAVITAPTLRLDGSVLARPGYDAQTGLLLDMSADEVVPVPVAPTTDQVQAALAQLMHPFQSFPFDDALSRSVLLSALLTACLRPVLPTAPAHGFDAPVQGSGKTLLALCVGALADKSRPTVWPHTANRSQGRSDDEETRKRVFTALRSGSRVLVWDNVVGVFDSAALAAALTSETFTDRVLGKSEAPTVPNKALFLLTGNNLCLAGDMPRRVLSCRINPQSERPFAREFDLDPLAYTQAHRQRMVSAALTLVRGWLTSGAGKAPGRMASFEQWDDLVRQTVAWVAGWAGSGAFADVMKAVDDAQGADPEQDALHELLVAIWAVYASRAFTAKELLQSINDGFRADTEPVREALADIAGGDVPRTAKSLGRLLRFRHDRLVRGLALRKAGSDAGNVQRWRIEQKKDSKADDPGFEGFAGFNCYSTRAAVTDATTTYKHPETKPVNAPNPGGW